MVSCAGPPSMAGRLRHQPDLSQAHRGGIRLDQGKRRLAKVKVRGRAKVEAVFTFSAAAYNLVRIPKLLAQGTHDRGDHHHSTCTVTGPAAKDALTAAGKPIPC